MGVVKVGLDGAARRVPPPAKLDHPMSATLQRCAVHVERPAFARCMACAKTLCQECATQWDGIWHCAPCLATKRGTGVQRSPVLSWIGVVTLSLLLLFGGARVMVWTAAVIAGMF